MANGIVSNIFYQEKLLTAVLPQRITVHFLKLFSGLPVRTHRGETFPQSLAIGIGFMCDITVGATRVHIFSELSKGKDCEYLMVDGRITRVNQHGASKKHLNMIKQLANSEVI